ncbi:hypothetical protein T11_8460 [Trichinella zimbabwensis]|uniref:Uncharacterized protein n=1 Tax=Trichinella zimbabwensis TaxID=268475 RepID=A0A0V1FF84_9BILA|nr:hypothetical protein T11_8460 [Trichinella zimbabwensis]
MLHLLKNTLPGSVLRKLQTCTFPIEGSKLEY